MKKFISLVLALVMALSLTTVAWGATLTAFPADDADGSADNVITLTDDVKLDAAATLSGVTVLIPADKTVVVDLSGKTLTTSGDVPVFEVKGNLTVKNGIITSTNTQPVFYGNNGSTANKGTSEAVLTLDGLTVTAASHIVFGNGAAPAWKSVTVTGGNYTTSGAGFIYDMAWDGVVTMTGVKATATGTKALVEVGGYGKSTATITDCTFTSAGTGVLGYAIGASYGAQVTINGGTYVGADIVAQAHETTYNGGPVPTVTINGGSFTGKLENNPAGVGEGEIVITGGTFTDDVSDYVADGSSTVVSGGKLVVSVGNTGSTNSYDDDDVTIIAKDGSKVAIADGAKVVMTQESKKTVNGKFASLVPAHFTYNGVKYVVCHEASATHVVTVKGVKYYTCAFNGVVPSVEKDGGVLYTAPKKATCGKVGVNEDKYVVIDNVYYLLSDSGTNYALVGGKMVVYSNTTGTMQEHVYDAVKSELKYNTDRTVATFKCAVCNNTIPVVAKKPNFATNYTAITLGNEGTYYYVSNTTGTTVSGGTTTGGTVNSADTFDAGIAMYVGMSVMAAAGSAVVIGKKKD